MSFRTFDPVCALLVVDLQQGTVHGPSAVATGPVVANAARLAQEFRRRALPVVLVSMSGGAPGRIGVMQGRPSPAADLGALVPELGEEPSDVRVVKDRWGAFSGTDLAGLLRERGVTQVLVVGMATSIGVESTARAAYDLGLNVAVVADAVADRFAEQHANSLGRVFPLLGEVGTTAEALELLGARTD